MSDKLIRRSNRTVKKVVLFVPTETTVEDDYCTDEYDTELDSNIMTDEECKSSSDESGDEECDENGNLKDFIVDDDDVTDSDEECE